MSAACSGEVSAPPWAGQRLFHVAAWRVQNTASQPGSWHRAAMAYLLGSSFPQMQQAGMVWGRLADARHGAEEEDDDDKRDGPENGGQPRGERLLPDEGAPPEVLLCIHRGDMQLRLDP